jgi:hypothetical protein
MSTNTYRNTKYEDLGETWRCHQTARILQRHQQFGQHCQLDLDALLAGVARTMRRANPDSAPSESLRQLNVDPVDSPLLSRRAAPTVQASRTAERPAPHARTD